MAANPLDVSGDLFAHLLGYQNSSDYAPAPRYDSASQKRNREAADRYRQAHPTAAATRQRAEKWKPYLYRRQKGLCALCQKALGQQFEVDHVIGVVDGGMNNPRNLRAVHGTCNKKRRRTKD